MVMMIFPVFGNQNVQVGGEPPGESGQVPSDELEALVIAAFQTSHDGFSADEVLLHDERRDQFLSEVAQTQTKSKGLQVGKWTDDEICAALLHVRKSGGRLPKATRRAKEAEPIPSARLTAVAEIAARRLDDGLRCHTDRILTNSAARQHFDATVQSIVGKCDCYAYRKAALKLRKTRRLQPELLSRVTDWKRHIREYRLDECTEELAEIPQRPGVYIFRDATGYLYIGQAKDLRARLNDHLSGSDRKALSKYLDGAKLTEITLEVHIFEDGSPGEDLRTRRAYESELIRTRSPRLNIKP